MLGKVIKNEFKDTWKVLLPLNLALIVVTICGMIALNIFSLQSNMAGFVVAGVSITYMLGLFALVITSFIYLAVRFYKSMYGAEGYLTHTLPVSSFSNLHGKMIVAVLWDFLSLVLTIASIMALSYALVVNMSGAIGENPSVAMMVHEFEQVFGAPVWILILKVLGYLLLSAMSGLLMIYACLSIGQLFNKHKIGAAVVTYIIFYIIMQIISFLVMLGTQMDNFEKDMAMIDAGQSAAMLPDMTGAMIQTIVMIIIYYCITAYICNKKLNLD